MPLLPGEILNHRYRMVSLLAEGPYGAVYRGWDLTDRQEVAVKEYLDWILSDAGQCIIMEKGYAPVRQIACP